MSFSDALLDEIRAKAPLIEIATEFWGEPNKGTSHKFGARWGNQGSRHVDAQAHLWHDYEDGIHADVFELVMKETGRSFPEAVAFAAERAGITLPDNPAAGPEKPASGRSASTASDSARGQERQPAPAPAGKSVIAATYDYVSPDGDLLYQVARLNRQLPDSTLQRTKDGKGLWKTFLQRRPSGIGDGSWIWGLNEGEFMRPAPGKDWRAIDPDKFAKWPHGEKRWFNSDIDHTIYRHNLVEQAIAQGKLLAICEGEKDVHTLEAWGFAATTNSGGAGNWTPKMASIFRGADVVILADDDEPGRKRVETVALSLRGIAKRIRAITSWGGPKDVTDWKEQAGGDASKLGEIINTLPDWRPAPPVSRMGAVGLHELHHPSLRHEFVIDGFLDRQGVAMMPGASGSGKTFLVLEMAMCIATGQPFWGMDVKPGLVLYQAGEGKQGVTKRIDAWLQDRGVPPDAGIPFQMLTRRINLFTDDKDTDDFIVEGKAWAAYYDLPVRMAVVDTFNKAITGANEIAGQDMGKVISRMERISTELDCVVLSPIHKSKEGNMRGHGSLKGDASNVIEVNELNIRDHNGRIIRTVTLDKNKDGEKGKPLRFVLRQVVLGDDERGKPITTCVIDRPDGDEEEYGRQGKLSLNQILALKALRQAVEDSGEPAPNGIRAGSSVHQVVKYRHWEERFAKTWQFTAPETEIEARKKELQRIMMHAGKVLLAGDYIGRDNDLGIVWLTGKDDRPKREAKLVEKAKPSPLMTPEDAEVPF